MYSYSFEKLEVWQISRRFTSEIYKITANFPEVEKYGIVSQLRRASISICSNIAEGNGRISTKDRAHFFQLAYSSALEVFNQLIISNDLEWIDNDTFNGCRIKINEITNKLNALHKKLIKK